MGMVVRLVGSDAELCCWIKKMKEAVGSLSVVQLAEGLIATQRPKARLKRASQVCRSKVCQNPSQLVKVAMRALADSGFYWHNI